MTEQSSGVTEDGVDSPGQTEVCHLDVHLGADQTVPGGQVPVDVVVPLQIRHAFTHL